MKNLDLLLIRLAKCYFRGSLEFSLLPSDIEAMTWDWQQKFLDITVNSELVKQQPISSAFSKFFFKLLTAYLENREVHDGMYIHLCQAMDNPCNNSFLYRHYVIGNNLTEIISIKEMNKMVVNGTTGMRTWQAAIVLADWALYNKNVFSGKKVLELGSGVGFTGVTIAKHCKPKSMYLTDCHSGVLRTICDNIKINFPQMEEDGEEETIFKSGEQEIGALILDWNAVENISCNIVPDVVIGADIVYDPTTIKPLCEVLRAFFDRNKQLNVYVASAIRNEETFQAFKNSLVAMNLSYKELRLNESVFIEWNQNGGRKSIIQINCK